MSSPVDIHYVMQDKKSFYKKYFKFFLRFCTFIFYASKHDNDKLRWLVILFWSLLYLWDFIVWNAKVYFGLKYFYLFCLQSTQVSLNFCILKIIVYFVFINHIILYFLFFQSSYFSIFASFLLKIFKHFFFESVFKTHTKHKLKIKSHYHTSPKVKIMAWCFFFYSFKNWCLFFTPPVLFVT